MSRVPVGKVLLRNVIRHTGAHNKIQEESEMWKIREWEKQTEETYWRKQSRMLSDTSSSRMRSDGFDEESHRADWRAKTSQFLDPIEDDFRARSWNKKLYECEANMPDSTQSYKIVVGRILRLNKLRLAHLCNVTECLDLNAFIEFLSDIKRSVYYFAEGIGKKILRNADGVTVAIKSYTLKNLIQIAISKKEMNKMLSMARRNLIWESNLPVIRTNGKKQRNHTGKSKKNDHTKSERKRKRSRQEHHPILPRRVSAQKRLQVPAKGNTSARKRPGKCLPGNLPLLLGRKVTFPMQAAQPPAALRTVNLRRKKRNVPPKRERNVIILCRRGTVKYQRRGARGRTGKWQLTRNQRIAQMRTDEEIPSLGCGSDNKVEDRGGCFSFSTAPRYNVFNTVVYPSCQPAGEKLSSGCLQDVPPCFSLT